MQIKIDSSEIRSRLVALLKNADKPLNDESDFGLIRSIKISLFKYNKAQLVASLINFVSKHNSDRIIS